MSREHAPQAESQIIPAPHVHPMLLAQVEAGPQPHTQEQKMLALMHW